MFALISTATHAYIQQDIKYLSFLHVYFNNVQCANFIFELILL